MAEKYPTINYFDYFDWKLWFAQLTFKHQLHVQNVYLFKCSANLPKNNNIYLVLKLPIKQEFGTGIKTNYVV